MSGDPGPSRRGLRRVVLLGGRRRPAEWHPCARTVARMGVLGEMFPGRKIQDESTEAGDGQEHLQLGPIDLDNRTVQVQRVVDPDPESDGEPPQS
jgi:hypothetical protein